MPSWRQHPNAPSPGTSLCPLETIPDGSCREVIFGEGPRKLRMIAMREGANVWAYVNSCPHFSLPLNAKPNTFLISSPGHVMCAFHCAIFQFQDGLCIDGPATGLSLEAVPVEVQDGQVLLKAA